MNFTEHKDSQIKNLPRIAVVAMLHVMLFAALINEVRVNSTAALDNPVTIIDEKPQALEANKDIEIKDTVLPKIVFPVIPHHVDEIIYTLPPDGNDKHKEGEPPITDGGGDKYGGEKIAELTHKSPVYVAAVVNANACDKPAYPAASIRTGEEGIVTLAMLIGADGRVLDANIEKSSGFNALDKAAKLGLSMCKFKPASTDGIAEKSWTKIQYVWKID